LHFLFRKQNKSIETQLNLGLNLFVEWLVIPDSVPLSERAPMKSRPGNEENIKMDVLKMLADLRQERDQLEEAIVTLERLANGRGRRRGRPPSWMTATKRRGRPPGSKNKVKEVSAA
jgi:hypothetical protein